MKKILFAALLISAMVYGIVRTSQQPQVSELVLENIKALADEEYEKPVRCIGIGSLDCPISHSKVQYITGGYNAE